MKVCFLVNEYFGWGKYGGFGSSARLIAGELARRGVEVFVATPRRRGQQPVERLDGVTVMSYSSYSLREQAGIYRSCGADIYHSQEPSLATYMAMNAMPQSKHVVTCQDTRMFGDWVIELRSYLSERRPKALLTLPYEDNPLVSRAVRKSDAVFCEARFLIAKARRKYRLEQPPGFLPNPVCMPEVEGRGSCKTQVRGDQGCNQSGRQSKRA